MRVSQPVILVGLLAALSGWFVRGLQVDRPAAASSSPLSDTAQASDAAADSNSPSGIIRRDSIPSGNHSRRNLFVYATQEPPIQHAVLPPTPTPPPVLPLPMPVARVEEQPRLRFTYRYIGRFGPDRNPVAAFARDGEIVTARTGDRLDQHFTLRSIGIEIVEVEAIADGFVEKLRIEN